MDAQTIARARTICDHIVPFVVEFGEDSSLDRWIGQSLRWGDFFAILATHAHQVAACVDAEMSAAHVHSGAVPQQHKPRLQVIFRLLYCESNVMTAWWDNHGKFDVTRFDGGCGRMKLSRCW